MTETGMSVAALGWETQRLRNRIIQRLLNANGAFVSGTELSQAAGVTRTAVWKHIRGLEELGFTVESVRHVGYRLTHTPDLVLEPLLALHLNPEMRLGRRVWFWPELDSTNNVAGQLALDPETPHGTVVSARVQTGGRGRRGRTWFSPAEGLWFSVILRDPMPLSRAAEVTLLASVAVRRAILSQLDLPIQIKWPNDLLCDGRKVCGILAEVRADGEVVQHVVLGIGINANIPAEAFPKELTGVATSLLAAAGRPVHRTALTARVLQEFEPLFRDLVEDGPGFAGVVDEWRAASHTLGRWVRIQTPTGLIEGTALDIDTRGVLTVRLDNGRTVPVHSGDVLFDSP